MGVKNWNILPKAHLDSGHKVNKSKIDKFGFIEGDLAEALKKSKLQNKPILIDFSARWCPGCVRYEQEVFPTREFKALTSDFVKVKIDLDIFENQLIAEKYKVKFIPTLVIVDSEEKEIDRLVDFQPLGKLSAFLRVVLEDPTPIETLSKNLVSVRPVDRRRVGRRLLATGHYAEAIEVLEDIEPVPTELLEARLSLARFVAAENESTKDALIKELRSSIKAEPRSYRSISWRTELAELVEETKEKVSLRQAGVELADKLLTDEKLLNEVVIAENFGEGAGYEKIFIAMSRAELIEASGASAEEIKSAWQYAANVGRSIKIPSSKIGPSMRWLIILVQAAEYAEAEKLARRLLAFDKNNPELQRRLLRTLVEQGKSKEAVDVGKQALRGSYGRNKIWVVEQLAKAYLASHNTSGLYQGVQLLEDYLGSPDVDWSNMKSTKKNLEDLNQKFKDKLKEMN